MSWVTIVRDEDKGAQKKKTEEVTFAVNMHCDNCKAKIERALTWHKGIIRIWR
jgi:hypothetical protein